MKKIIYAFLFLFFSASVAFGQLSLKPFVGINFPSLTKEISSFDFEGNVGYQFGADLLIGGNFFIQPGVNFESSSLTVQDVGDLDVSRLNIPVLIGFRLFEPEDSRGFGFRIFAGPNFAINLNEDLDDAFGSIDKDDIKGSKISALAGLGIDISILFVDAGYKFGLTDVFEGDNIDAKKNIFYVNAGIRLGF